MTTKKIYQEFRREMAKLKKELDAKVFFETLNAKLTDFAVKNPSATPGEIERAVNSIFPPQLKKYTDEVFEKFDDTLLIINDLYSDLSIDITRDILGVQRIEDIANTTFGKYELNESKKMVKAIREGLADKLSRGELAKEIARAGDRAKQYADVIAGSSVRSYARSAKFEKANLAEVFWYRYVGPIRPNTRDFCIHELGYAETSARHINEINSLDNGDGQLKPVIIHCGGWNCFHDWEPDIIFQEENKNG